MSANLLRETIVVQLLLALAWSLFLQVRVLSEVADWSRVKVIPFLGYEAVVYILPLGIFVL